VAVQLPWPSTHGLKTLLEVYFYGNLYGMYMEWYAILFYFQSKETLQETPNEFQIGPEVSTEARANGQPTHPAQGFKLPLAVNGHAIHNQLQDGILRGIWEWFVLLYLLRNDSKRAKKKI